jgi:hypothetical protein
VQSARCRDGALARDRELDAALPGDGAVIGAAVLEIDRPHESERPEHGVVESPAALEIRDPEGYVIDHRAASRSRN